MQNAVNCSDELAFTSLDVAKADVAQTPYPQLVAFPVEGNQQTLLTCLSYPTALDRSVTEPVVSDIPALLYLGPLDNETPVSWGREVAKGLSRSTVVEWANQGHVAAAKDPKFCVGDIAAGVPGGPRQRAGPDLRPVGRVQAPVRPPVTTDGSRVTRVRVLGGRFRTRRRLWRWSARAGPSRRRPRRPACLAGMLAAVAGWGIAQQIWG